jgi:hypothetical protein
MVLHEKNTLRRWYCVLAGIVVCAVLLLAPLQAPLAVASPKAPTCHSPQMKVTIGYTRELRTPGPSHEDGEWIGWVHYTNEAATCVMSTTDVGVQAVTRSHALLGQPSVSDAVARLPFLFHRGAVATAPIGLVVTIPLRARSCVAEPVTTIEVTGYLYGWANHFFSLSNWHELALCAGDHVAAITGPLRPI